MNLNPSNLGANLSVDWSSEHVWSHEISSCATKIIINIQRIKNNNNKIPTTKRNQDWVLLPEKKASHQQLVANAHKVQKTEHQMQQLWTTPRALLPPPSSSSSAKMLAYLPVLDEILIKFNQHANKTIKIILKCAELSLLSSSKSSLFSRCIYKEGVLWDVFMTILPFISTFFEGWIGLLLMRLDG